MKKTKLTTIGAEEIKMLEKIGPKAIVDMVEEKMPEWVRGINTKEDMANSILASAQEMLLVIEDSLIRHFKFSQEDLKKLHNEIKPVLQGVKEFERHGLSMLSPGDVEKVGDLVQEKGIAGLMAEIANLRFTKEKMNRSGLEYPTLPGAAPFIKKIGGK